MSRDAASLFSSTVKILFDRNCPFPVNKVACFGRSLPKEWFSSALATDIRAPAQVQPVHFRVSPRTGEPLRSQVLLGRDLVCPKCARKMLRKTTPSCGSCWPAVPITDAGSSKDTCVRNRQARQADFFIKLRTQVCSKVTCVRSLASLAVERLSLPGAQCGNRSLICIEDGLEYLPGTERPFQKKS